MHPLLVLQGATGRVSQQATQKGRRKRRFAEAITDLRTQANISHTKTDTRRRLRSDPTAENLSNEWIPRFFAGNLD